MKLWPRKASVPSKSSELARYNFSEWANDILKFQGMNYPLGYTTTYGTDKSEPIPVNFTGMVQGALKSDGIIWAIELARVSIFSEARFQFQGFKNGRPQGLFGSPELAILETPWESATTGDLLIRMLLDADFAGNAFIVRYGGELVRLRPDWVDIVLEVREVPLGEGGRMVPMGHRRVGYMYYEGGKLQGKKPAVLMSNEVCHWAPVPDPEANYRGMSWLSPIVREVQADTQIVKHEVKFFENAATPNLAVSLKSDLSSITPEQFNVWVDAFDASHRGVENAYKTLYTAGGADVSVIGANMKEIDFSAIQGAGEARLAAAGGIHPIILGIQQALAGSSLNAGNFNAARRITADKTWRPLWRSVSGALQNIITVPGPIGMARLWYDDRDIAFLREDEKDLADIQSTRAQSIRQLVDAGFEPDSVVNAIDTQDFGLLVHTGLYSVQLTPPGTGAPSIADTAPIGG